MRKKDIRLQPSGIELLHDPTLNKGTAFSEEEVDALGLRGLLPPRVFTQEEQAKRIMEGFRRLSTDLEKYIHMMALLSRNEALFYYVVMRHIDELLPIVYTPTVGRACQEYGHIWQRPRGIFISVQDRGRIKEILCNWPEQEVDVIVVTDGERILGLGDLGANGMGIPVGKLALYTVCAGVHPSLCLPITLDTGTNNESLLEDSLYIGLRRNRVRGSEYDELLDEFMQAVKEVFHYTLIQFEDFNNANAFRLLKKYKDNFCMFNDDIQGTSSVVLAGLYSALKLSGGTMADQKILFLGAGEAGIGIGYLVTASLQAEGLSEREAKTRCWYVDSKGLVVASRTDLGEHKRAFAHDAEGAGDLINSIRKVRPTILIGASGQPQIFDQQIIEEMSVINRRPVIFALSNPTSKSECTAEQAYAWSEGRAIFASGSPFSPVQFNGKTYVPGQGNNAYIFPGVGLGVIASGSRRVTEEMFLQASRVLADSVAEEELESGCIYPSLKRIRMVSVTIALTVAKIAYEKNLATKPRPKDLEKYIQSQQYHPDYVNYLNSG